MKKVLSLVLVIAMVLSSMSFAFASTFEDVADSDYEVAIETMKALGVIDGFPDGTFRPEGALTRAQLAKLLVEALGFGGLTGGASNFSDTNGHWADSYIAIASGMGLVNGYPDGTFKPEGPVKYEEAYAMIIRALGYTDASLRGVWPTNYMVKALDLGLTKDLALTTGPADRGGIAQVLYNALEAKFVIVDADNNITPVEKGAGAQTLIDRLGELNDELEVESRHLDPENKAYKGNLVDLAPYMFQKLTVYENKDGVVVYVKSVDSLVLEGTVDKIDGTSLTVKDLSGKKVTIELPAGASIDKDDIFENGSFRETNKNYNVLKTQTDSIKVIANDANENGKINTDEIVGFVTTMKTGIIRVEQEYIDGKDKLDGLLLPDTVFVKGDADSLEDIKEDDIVVEYLSEDEEVTTLVVSRDTVEGKVTRITDEDTFYIDGVKYDVAKLYIVGYDYFDLNDEGTFFLDHEGKVVDFEGAGAGPTDYAVVIGVAGGTTKDNRFTGNKSIDEYPSLKLATQDGEEIIYDVQVKVTDAGVAKDSAKAGNSAIVKDNLAIDTTVVNEDFLIQYKLNKDDRISEIKVVRDLKAENTYKEVDLGKTTNALAADAVIFDSGDDYAVVKEDVLPTKVDAYIVRNSSGQIEVLVAEKDEVGSEVDTVFVYIYNVDAATKDGDKVQWIDLYTGDADVNAYTTDTNTVDEGAVEGVFAVKYDGEDIDSAVAVTTTSGIVAGGRVISGKAQTVNARGGMVEIDDEWFILSENGTVLTIDEDGDVDGLADLYDIVKGVNGSDLVVYVNADGEIDLILIYEYPIMR